MFVSRPALAVDITVTADNAYAFGYGTSTGLTSLSTAVENTTAGNIFDCSTGPETYLGVPNTGGAYLYIVAYSDDNNTQGVLGQFVQGASRTYTGIGGWEVYATGLDLDPGSGGPTLAQVNAQITLANANNGNAASSVGWVTQAPVAGRTGVLASGETNASAGGTFPIVCSTGSLAIDSGARWMWYNRNSNGSGNPFSSPAPAGEYLIFRLPVAQVANPTAFYVNKDIKNTTGVTAAGVEMEIAGHHSYTDIYHATTPTFAVDATGINDKLRWTGGNIAPNALVHVGFRTSDSVVKILGVTMLNGAGASIGCALQLNTGIHTNANLTFVNNVSNCASSSMFVGNAVVEYFANEVPLADLLPGVSRSPLRTDVLPMATTLLAPGDSLSVAIPSGPANARWAVVNLKVGSTAALTETEDWLQVPVPVQAIQVVPATSNLLLIVLSLLLGGFGVWFLSRRNRQARNPV